MTKLLVIVSFLLSFFSAVLAQDAVADVAIDPRTGDVYPTTSTGLAITRHGVYPTTGSGIALIPPSHRRKCYFASTEELPVVYYRQVAPAPQIKEEVRPAGPPHFATVSGNKVHHQGGKSERWTPILSSQPAENSGGHVVVYGSNGTQVVHSGVKQSSANGIVVYGGD